MSSFGYDGKIRMEAGAGKEIPVFEGGYPYQIPEVYLYGSGETYFPQCCFDWDDDSVVMVRDKRVLKYTKSTFVELLAENEEGEIVWMDGRTAPYENCWEGHYLGDIRGAHEYKVEEFDLETFQKRKYKVTLEEENCWSHWDYYWGVSNFVGRETLGCHFEIEDGTLMKYLGHEEEIVIPDGVVSIAPDCFKRGISFNRIVLPKTLTNISGESFLGCSTKQIEVNKDNPKYYSKDGLLIDREAQTLVWAYAGDTIPSDGSIKIIGANAFHGRDDVKMIEVPEMVCRIEDKAFYGCTYLNEMIIPDRLVDDIERIGGYQLEKEENRWIRRCIEFSF